MASGSRAGDPPRPRGRGLRGAHRRCHRLALARRSWRGPLRLSRRAGPGRGDGAAGRGGEGAQPRGQVPLRPQHRRRRRACSCRRTVAAAVRDRLLPLADMATPNRHELAWLTGQEAGDNDGLARAARGARRRGSDRHLRLRRRGPDRQPGGHRGRGRSRRPPAARRGAERHRRSLRGALSRRAARRTGRRAKRARAPGRRFSRWPRSPANWAPTSCRLWRRNRCSRSKEAQRDERISVTADRGLPVVQGNAAGGGCRPLPAARRAWPAAGDHDHRLLRQPRGARDDLRCGAGGDVRPPQRRQPGAAVRGGGRPSRHLGGDRVRRERARGAPPGGHGPRALRRGERVPARRRDQAAISSANGSR